MTLPPESGSHAGESKSCGPDHGRCPDGLATFIPMAFDGLAWSRIVGPQRDARAACLLAAAHIHLFGPEVPLRDLDARAEAAIRALEGGAATVMVIDDRHRVDRAGLTAGTSGMPETPARSRAPLVAIPPRSAADRSLRLPSRRPTGVRASPR